MDTQKVIAEITKEVKEIMGSEDTGLLLKDRINTPTGKKLAQGRHEFLETYLDRFFQEWKGKI